MNESTTELIQTAPEPFQDGIKQPVKPLDLPSIIQAAIKQAIAMHTPKPPPTDAQIVAAIERLAKCGYEPCEEMLPIIKDVLSGYGVLLSGLAGVGKTFFFRAMGKRVVESADIIDWGMANIWKFHEQWDGDTLCIDDLGAEHEVSEWGVKDDLMKAIIAHRAEKQTGITHVTTNLTALQIRDRYGDRTLSRLVGMCRSYRLAPPVFKDRRKAQAHMANAERKDGQ